MLTSRSNGNKHHAAFGCWRPRKMSTGASAFGLAGFKTSNRLHDRTPRYSRSNSDWARSGTSRHRLSRPSTRSAPVPNCPQRPALESEGGFKGRRSYSYPRSNPLPRLPSTCTKTAKQADSLRYKSALWTSAQPPSTIKRHHFSLQTTKTATGFNTFHHVYPLPSRCPPSHPLPLRPPSLPPGIPAWGPQCPQRPHLPRRPHQRSAHHRLGLPCPCPPGTTRNTRLLPLGTPHPQRLHRLRPLQPRQRRRGRLRPGSVPKDVNKPTSRKDCSHGVINRYPPPPPTIPPLILI